MKQIIQNALGMQFMYNQARQRPVGITRGNDMQRMTLQKKLSKKKKGHQDSESDEDDDYRIYYTPTEV